MKTNSNVNKMCYISLIEKLITSFCLKKIKIGKVFRKLLQLCKFIKRFQMNCLVSWPHRSNFCT